MSATTDAMSQGAVLLYNNMSPAQPIKLAAAPHDGGGRASCQAFDAADGWLGGVGGFETRTMEVSDR